MIGRMETDRAEEARAALAGIPAQLAELRGMTVAQLKVKWLELFGEPTASRNKAYLRKRLGYRVQELAEGGLSRRARDRIEELLDGRPLPELTWRRGGRRMDAAQPVKPLPPAERYRDPRLPPVGSVIRKVHQGVEHAITVLDDGFECGGARYRSLSAIAKAVTGQVWNGFLWAGLNQPGRRATEAANG